MAELCNEDFLVVVLDMRNWSRIVNRCNEVVEARRLSRCCLVAELVNKGVVLLETTKLLT